MPFTCNICGEESARICVRCTKDACSNHLCEKCGRCSDCCECEVALEERGQGEAEMRGQGDAEMRRRGDAETAPAGQETE